VIKTLRYEDGTPTKKKKGKEELEEELEVEGDFLCATEQLCYAAETSIESMA
jgi:hypothetical protein